MVNGITRSLQRPLSERWKPTRQQRRVMYLLVEHSSTCDEAVLCRMPWCFFFFYLCGDRHYNEQIASLRRFYANISWNEWSRLAPDSQVNSFLQLNKAKDWPSIIGEYFDCPQPNHDFHIIDGYFERSGSVNYLAYSLNIPPEYLSINQYPWQEWTTDAWKQLEGLSKCPYVVDHQWVSFNGSVTTVCTNSPLQRVTLEDILWNRQPRKLSVVWQCARRLVKGAKALHRLGILYLCWKAESILLSKPNDINSIQLADLKYAVTKNKLESDSEIGNILSMALPADVLPPEMHRGANVADSDVGEHSDVWGIGVLLYHLMTGVPIHHEFRHQPRDEIPNKSVEPVQDGQTGKTHNAAC